MDLSRTLRADLVAQLRRAHILQSPRIEAALLAVERHRFVPSARLEEAYADQALAIKECDGLVLSSISQPSMIAHMLDLLAVELGDRVLEIGTGSGYNAALLAELAGASGKVVSVELERDLLERARTMLNDTGYPHVVLLHAEKLAAVHRPFERIIVTARATDIDVQWWRLLAPGGRIVVPLDIGYGGERAIGFVREGDRLVSVGSRACAFVELRGAQDTANPAIFFRSRQMRHQRDPMASTPLDIIAIERDRAEASLLEECDAVVARAHTLFALRRRL